MDTAAAKAPVAYLLIGLTGSGKTTYARRLEAAGVLKLSVDEEVFARHGKYGVDYPEDEYPARERPIVQEMQRRLVEAIQAGRSVVLDYGLWRRSERDAYKTLVEDAGGRWRLIYLKVAKTELLRRLAARKPRTDANALPVTPEMLDDFYARFDEPSGEGEEIVTGDGGGEGGGGGSGGDIGDGGDGGSDVSDGDGSDVGGPLAEA